MNQNSKSLAEQLHSLMPIKVTCAYCGSDAQLVTGKEIYPHRNDLYELKFWHCAPCSAFVGCHKNSPTNQPLGRLANAELREARQLAHKAFDSLWKLGEAGRREYLMKRSEAYMWLSRGLKIGKEVTHIGMFDLEQCSKTVELATAYTSGLKQIKKDKKAQLKKQRREERK